jgi:hypothetical protein
MSRNLAKLRLEAVWVLIAAERPRRFNKARNLRA